jgi:hypothetical protein
MSAHGQFPRTAKEYSEVDRDAAVLLTDEWEVPAALFNSCAWQLAEKDSLRARGAGCFMPLSSL